MARFVFLGVLALGLWPGPAVAQTSIVGKPGDEGTIEYEFQNASTGPNERGEEVRLVPILPQSGAPIIFGAVRIKEDSNLTPPITIEPGQTRTFVFPYQIAGTANDGTYDATLDLQMLNELTDPAPSSYDSIVQFDRRELGVAGRFTAGLCERTGRGST